MAEPTESRGTEARPDHFTDSFTAFPDPASLRRALRAALEASLPEIHVVAEAFLAEVSPIDLLAVGADGELISIRIAGPGGDAAALTRALADLSWLRPRQSDFLKLAPGLGIEPSAEPRVLLVAREFGRETLAAADNFPAETVALWRCRIDAANGRPALRIEPVVPNRAEAPRGARPGAATGSRRANAEFPSAAAAAPRPADPSRARPFPQRPGPEHPERSAPLTAPPSPSAFRTGLVDTDLEPAHRPDPATRPRHRSDATIASGV